MNEIIRERLKLIGFIAVLAVVAIILIGLTVLEIYTWSNYWNKSSEEIPSPASWLMLKSQNCYRKKELELL